MNDIITKSLDKVMPERIESAISYLNTHRYSFDQEKLQSGSAKKRHTVEVVLNGVRSWLCVIPTDNQKYQAKLAKEARVFTKLEKIGAAFTPKIIYYSPDQHWYIRTSIEGELAGHVYCFSDRFLANELTSKKLTAMLKWFQALHLEIDDQMSSAHFIANLENIIEKDGPYATLISRFAKVMEASAAKIDNKSMHSFIHGDLQPTNVLMLPSNELGLIDFESCKIGHPLFDFASLYHRAEYAPNWQEKFKQEYAELLISQNTEFDEELFKVFLYYFFALDIVSLDIIYIRKLTKPLHDTELSVESAEEIASFYHSRFDQYLKERSC